MKINRNEEGFGAIELIVIVVAVGLIGVVGWFAYNNMQKNPKPSTSTTPTTTARLSTDKTAPETTPETKATIVKIKEAGIEFTIPEGYPTITYKIGQAVDPTNFAGYDLFADAAINADYSCQLKQDGSFGSLNSYSKKYFETNGGSPEEIGAKLVGDKYWGLATLGVCDQNNPDNKFNKLKNAISSSIKETK